MLRTLTNLNDYYVSAKDGECGTVADLMFEQGVWVVRYIVVDTGEWMKGRKVIIPPHEFSDVSSTHPILKTEQTREMIENSPRLADDKPLSRQDETRLHGYYRWQPYWVDDNVPGGRAPEPLQPEEHPEESNIARKTREDDPQGNTSLFSGNELLEYKLQGNDGIIGRIDNLVIDDESWMVRYLVVIPERTDGNKRKLISTEWVDRVMHEQFSAFVDFTLNEIKESPDFDPEESVDRSFEAVLHDYYGRPRYWTQPK